MRLRRLGNNEECPCGSGAKHKRCCAAGGKPWHRAGKYVVPYGVAKSDTQLSKLRDAIITCAYEAGLLPGHRDLTMSDLYRTLGREYLAAVFLELGISAAQALFYERTGTLPHPIVWTTWVNNGLWCMEYEPDSRVKSIIEDALSDVIDLYGIRERRPDGSVAEFVRCNAVETSPGVVEPFTTEPPEQFQRQGED